MLYIINEFKQVVCPIIDWHGLQSHLPCGDSLHAVSIPWVETGGCRFVELPCYVFEIISQFSHLLNHKVVGCSWNLIRFDVFTLWQNQMLLVSELTISIIRSIQSCLEEATPNGDSSKNCIKSVASMSDCGAWCLLRRSVLRRVGRDHASVPASRQVKWLGQKSLLEACHMFAACDVSSNRIGESLKRAC